MKHRTVRSVYGALMAIAGVALGFLALDRGGITWPVLLLIAILIAYGGHLVSHSLMRELVEDAARLIRAWRGGGS